MIPYHSKKGAIRGIKQRDLLKIMGGSENLEFYKFVMRCLEWDPSKRMTPDEALQNPWIK